MQMPDNSEIDIECTGINKLKKNASQYLAVDVANEHEDGNRAQRRRAAALNRKQAQQAGQ